MEIVEVKPGEKVEKRMERALNVLHGIVPSTTTDPLPASKLESKFAQRILHSSGPNPQAPLQV